MRLCTRSSARCATVRTMRREIAGFHPVVSVMEVAVSEVAGEVYWGRKPASYLGDS